MHGRGLTGNLAINSPSWIWPSVPQTPQQETDYYRNGVAMVSI